MFTIRNNVDSSSISSKQQVRLVVFGGVVALVSSVSSFLIKFIINYLFAVSVPKEIATLLLFLIIFCFNIKSFLNGYKSFHNQRESSNLKYPDIYRELFRVEVVFFIQTIAMAVLLYSIEKYYFNGTGIYWIVLPAVFSCVVLYPASYYVGWAAGEKRINSENGINMEQSPVKNEEV